MLSMLETVFMILTSGELVVGILGNGFIGLTHFTACIKKQKLYLVDFILMSLAWARFTQLCLMHINVWVLKFSWEIMDILEDNKVLTSMWMLINHLCTWFSTCLAVFYFLKIASFPHPLFQCLKRSINKVIVTLLVVSVPFLLMVLPFPYNIHIIRYQVNLKYERNMTGFNYVTLKNNLNYMTIFTITSLPPFCLSLISFFLLLLSMRRHTKHMELNIRGLGDPSLEVHFRAMRSVFFFLVLFLLFHMALLLIVTACYSQYRKVIMMLGYLLGLLYPSAHSYVVIFGNSQMKKAFLGILWTWKHCLKASFYRDIHRCAI